jgi:YidC/Oxa1 family membrane protein insertase
MAGCLPMLIQMPVFFALYGVLRGAIELRQAPFMLWIDDLSAPDVLIALGSIPVLPDQIHLLPLLMAASTILMQRMTMVTDPTQKAMMYMMPVMMLVFFYQLPAGLNLYWTVQNLLSFGEQALVKGTTQTAAAKAA